MPSIIRIGNVIGTILDKLSLALLFVGSVGLTIMMLTTVGDALGRKIIGSIPGAFETSEALMAVVCFLPQAYVQMNRGHISVDIIALHFPPRIQAILRGISAIIGVACFGLLTWLTLGVAWSRTISGELKIGIIDFPVWPFRWFLPIGLGLLTAQILRTGIIELNDILRRN